MNQPKKVVIAGYARSPFAPARGDLSKISPVDLVAQTITGLIQKSGVQPGLIEDLKLGCAFPEAEQGMNMARLAVLAAGLPDTIAGNVVNRFCGSSMETIHNAAGAIAFGSAECVIAAGVESMSIVPMGGHNPVLDADLYQKMPGAYIGMGNTAENIARQFDISRDAQEEFALRSQFNAAAAKKAGAFDAEIVPIVLKDGTVVSEDSCPRATSKEKMAALRPVFEADGSVTAATSSPLTDGASAVLVCSEDFAKRHGLTIMAEVVAAAVEGCDPTIMGMGPVNSTRKALAQAGITTDRLDVVEINEAFAAQALACLDKLQIEFDRVNKNGGAIALGHPLGASGARITGSVAQQLHDGGGEYGLATMCIGGGQGISTVLKKYTPTP